MLLTSSIQIENRSNQNNLIRLAMRLSRYAGVTPGDRVPRASGTSAPDGCRPAPSVRVFFQVSVFSLERR